MKTDKTDRACEEAEAAYAKAQKGCRENHKSDKVWAARHRAWEACKVAWTARELAR